MKSRPEQTMLTARTGVSQIWQGITKASPLLAKGTKFSVGNESLIRFCSDQWLNTSPLYEVSLHILSQSEREATAADCWDRDKG